MVAAGFDGCRRRLPHYRRNCFELEDSEVGGIERFYFIGLQWFIFIVFIWGARFYPRNPQPTWSKDTLLNAGVNLWLHAVKLFLILPLIFHLDIWYFQHHGNVPRLFKLEGMDPVWQFIAIFLVDDLLVYWVHRAEHAFPFMWTFHRVHHSTEKMDASSAERAHPVESLYEYLFVHFVYSSGTPLPVLVSYVTVRWISGAWRHSNFDFPMSSRWARAVNRVVNNPHFHGWHHVNHPSAYGKNYGSMLTIWDRLFGTHLDTDKKPEGFGLDENYALRNRFLGLNLLIARANPSQRPW